jgi:hypothetical protein
LVASVLTNRLNARLRRSSAFVTTRFFTVRGGFRPVRQCPPGIHTELEIYFRFVARFAPWLEKASPRAAIMSAQKRETKKNFIALLSEATEEQRAADRPAKPSPPVRRGLLGLLAAALHRDVNG